MSLSLLAKSAPVPVALIVCLYGCSSSNDKSPSDVPGSNDGGGGDATMSSDDDGGSKSNPEGGNTGTPDDGGAAGDVHVSPPFDAGGDAGMGHVLVDYPASALDAGINEWLDFPATTAGVTPTSLWSTLNKLFPGTPGNTTDTFASLSRDGVWAAIVTDSRFNCQSGGCLALVKVDGSSGGLVYAQGGSTEIDPEDRPTVYSGGQILVFPNSGGPHGWDLYSMTLSGGQWSAPLLITAGMPGGADDGGSGRFAHNPEFSYDGTTVVYECGDSPYQDDGVDICESKIDGSGTTVVVSHMIGPSATDSNYTHHPDYAPDGTIVFEADWVQGGGSSERIWRFTAPSTVTLLDPTGVADDNSPCVMPDGRIASLWLPNSNHELKIMNADGTNGVVLETDVDVVDVGQSCSR